MGLVFCFHCVGLFCSNLPEPRVETTRCQIQKFGNDGYDTDDYILRRMKFLQDKEVFKNLDELIKLIDSDTLIIGTLIKLLSNN